MDLTNNYQGTNEYPGVMPPEGQRIITPTMSYEFWVEPITGNTVKIVEESSGDYFVDEKTGQQLSVIALWAGQTTNDNTRHLIQQTKDALKTRSLVLWWIPGCLFVFGIGLIGYGYNNRLTTT